MFAMIAEKEISRELGVNVCILGIGFTVKKHQHCIAILITT